MKYIVFGLGISGNGAKNLLEKQKLEYIVVDDKHAIKSSEAISLLKKDDVVIKSPGISWNNDFLNYCKKEGLKIISEIDFALDYLNEKTKLIAITGTNGKTTTCTKTYELLKYAGYKVALGGNEGHSFCDILVSNNDYDYIVLELSSYQLENNPKIKPYIALITNLTPDHLLRYKDVSDYYLTKFNIFKNQDKNDYAIINKDDKVFNSIKFDINANKIFIENDEKYLKFEGKIILEKTQANLKGEHNVQNMLNMIAIACLCGVSFDKIKEFLKNVKPLEHRNELFMTYKNTHFINDSKGTNVESTLVAIETYKDKMLYLIAGGQDKKIDNTKLFESIYKNCDFVFVIGENSFLYKQEFEKTNFKNYLILDTVDNVIKYIKENLDLKKEKYILFSPATASFDQFENFEKRGIYFKQKVFENFGGKNV